MTAAKLTASKRTRATGVSAPEEQARAVEALQAALIEGEESGDAEPGTFDRVRAHIRNRARDRGAPEHSVAEDESARRTRP
jgi:hypothetical protein